MITFWTMVRGRLVAAVVAGIVMALTAAGVTGLSEHDSEQISAFANSLISFVGFASYSLFHTWRTKRKLDAGKIAPENVEKLPYFGGVRI